MNTIEVRVRLSGIILTVMHDTLQDTVAVMPDCRGGLVAGSASPPHADGSEGAPHVGYLSFNLANEARIGSELDPGDDARGVVFEAVHQLNREEISFEVDREEWDPASSARQEATIAPASFNTIANNTPLKAGLFDEVPDKAVLSRILLPGGGFTGENFGRQWVYPPALQEPTCGMPDKIDYHGAFACRDVWSRKLRRKDLALRLTNFETGKSQTVQLLPDSNGVIEIHLGNLCAHNVLEWPGFRPLRTSFDVDFKWYFRLFDVDPKKLFGAELPYPRIDQRVPQTEGIDSCSRGCVTANFTYRPARRHEADSKSNNEVHYAN